MIKSYDELLDIAYQKGLTVFEDVPLNYKQRGLIFIDTILLSDRLKTLKDKRAVLAEEITHFDTNTGNILNNRYEEIRAHRALIKGNISLRELLDAIIDCNYSASYNSVAELLDVPEWLFKEIYNLYSALPFRDMTYRNCKITFNPIHIMPLGDMYEIA